VRLVPWTADDIGIVGAKSPLAVDALDLMRQPCFLQEI
jgi:hypothetical protein